MDHAECEELRREAAALRQRCGSVRVRCAAMRSELDHQKAQNRSIRAYLEKSRAAEKKLPDSPADTHFQGAPGVK